MLNQYIGAKVLCYLVLGFLAYLLQLLIFYKSRFGVTFHTISAILHLNERYYFDEDNDARYEVPKGLIVSQRLVVLSVISYIVAILSTLLFVSLNLYKS